MSDFNFISDYQGKRPDNIFERIGHPGKWYKAIPFSGSVELNFTGSSGEYTADAGGIILSNNTGVTITLTGGGEIPGTALSTGVILDLSIAKIVSTTGVGFILHRNYLLQS